MTPAFEDALTWLRYAEEDLEAARAVLSVPEVVARHPAWLAPQAAEKAVKAMLIARDLPFPKTHDLERLAALLSETGRPLEADADLATLTEYAVGPRYPGDLPDEVSGADAAEAVDMAERVVRAARAALASDREPGDREPGDRRERR